MKNQKQILCFVLAAALSAVGAWRSLQVEKGRGAPKELYEKLLETGANIGTYQLGEPRIVLSSSPEDWTS